MLGHWQPQGQDSKADTGNMSSGEEWSLLKRVRYTGNQSQRYPNLKAKLTGTRERVKTRRRDKLAQNEGLTQTKYARQGKQRDPGGDNQGGACNHTQWGGAAWNDKTESQKTQTNYIALVVAVVIQNESTYCDSIPSFWMTSPLESSLYADVHTDGTESVWELGSSL